MSAPAVSLTLEALYAQHHGWLVRWLRQRLAGADQAADLAQDTFLRLLSTRDADAVSSQMREPRAYLATVAQRLLVNHVRRRALEQAYLDSLAVLAADEQPSLEHQYIVLQALQDVDDMLSSLPDAAREAFLMSQLEGLTYAEIAERQQVTTRTVKRYMARAFEACILWGG